MYVYGLQKGTNTISSPSALHNGENTEEVGGGDSFEVKASPIFARSVCQFKSKFKISMEPGGQFF